MEIFDLILGIMSFLLSLSGLVYQVHQDIKRAATDTNSDGGATK